MTLSRTNACSEVHGSKQLSQHGGWQEVSRYHTRGESEDFVAHRQKNMQTRGFTLALKPRDITRSPKQGHWWPYKKDWCSPICFQKLKRKKKEKKFISNYRNIASNVANAQCKLAFKRVKGKMSSRLETGDGEQCTNTYCADSEPIEETRGRHEGTLTDVDVISHPVQRHCWTTGWFGSHGRNLSRFESAKRGIKS